MSHSLKTGMRHFFCFIILTVFLTGCSRIKFAYNQLDWVIPYYVENSVELTPNQSIYLEQQVRQLLDWHCNSHLAAYADLLRSANNHFQNGTVNKENIQETLHQLELYWKEIKRQASPAIANLLQTANDKQLDALLATLTKRNKAWRDEYYSHTGQALQEDYRRRMVVELERWFGPLTASQQLALADWGQQFKPLRTEAIKARAHWLASFRVLLRQRDDTSDFSAVLQQLLINPESIRTPEYQNGFEHNTKISIALIARIGQQLNDVQRRHLARTSDSIAQDFEQLACTEASTEPQTSGLLQSKEILFVAVPASS